MFDYIFTIGCFDKFHKGHINLLESMKKETEKIIVGLHDNNSIKKLKNITDIDSYDSRKKILENYAFDIFMINDVDPTKAIQKYIMDNLLIDLLNYNQLEPINIGSSRTNSKVINNQYTGELYFIHKFKDKFKYDCKDNNITITRTDNNCGWGQELVGWKKNWCFMRADDNINFPSINFVKSIMPIKYLPYTKEISATKLRDYKNNKVGLMNYLLQQVVDILNEHNIPYYLDCGTLLGCIRNNELMKKDTDVDVTIHLSYWDDLNSIDFDKYGLIKTRSLNGFQKRVDSNMISVKTKYSKLYCDIYANPAFPQLDNKFLNGKSYCVPINSDLYLKQLYGNWKVPSNKHASTRYHRGKGLVNSEYSKYWDKNFKIFECKL